MPVVTLSVQPVGVKFYAGDFNPPAGLAVYGGISYCDAVRRAAAGEKLLLRPGSITSCRWSPVVLGLKEAESGFEKRQEPRMEKTRCIYLAPLSSCEAGGPEPDVVILRDEPGTLRYLARTAGMNRCAGEYAGELDKSALEHLLEDRSDWKVKLLMTVNRFLALLQKQEWFRRLVAAVFRSETVSDLFDRIISRSMADMSICRNSTVIPHRSGRANVSFFCAGGIAWGMNRPGHMTSGWPYPVFQELREKVVLKW